MRAVFAFLLDLLPLDASGRRAVDETLKDWDHEVRQAPTLMSAATRTCVVPLVSAEYSRVSC